MKQQLLHTPDGVRDIYNGECKKKLKLQEDLHQTLLKYGYQDIQTPTFEFFDVFSNQIGSATSKDLYKFFDKEGNTLVLRPDFTPSVARSAVKYFTDEDMPVKLCYMGNSFLNSSDYQGRLKETTQIGAELIGDSSLMGDAEILAMVVDCFLASGLQEFQISLGHSQFFNELLKAAGIEDELEEKIKSLISNKNFFGVEECILPLNLDEDLMKLFEMIRIFDLSDENLASAKEYAKNYPLILSSIEDLEQIKSYLTFFEIEKYFSIEFGIISTHPYYTGIIFSGYSFGSGEPIVRGGRYDKLLGQFGKEAPSIGFAVVVDTLLAALSRQKIDIPVDCNSQLIIYTKDNYKTAMNKAKSLRNNNCNVTTLLMEKDRKAYEIYAEKNGIQTITFMDGEV